SWFARLLEVAKRRIASIPSVTAAYLDSILSAHGAEVVIKHNALEPADLVLIASSITDCNYEKELGQRARREFGAKVGYFGTFAATVPEFYEDAADFVVQSEIENLAPQLAKGQIPAGVVDAGFVSDLNSLPFPTWDQFNIRKYKYSIITARGITLPMLSSRGCPYTCGYCPYLVNSRYRVRRAENVVDEIEYLVKRFGIRGISFRDPMFTFHRSRTMDIAQRILSKGLNIRFGIETRTDKLDEEQLRFLHRAGLRSLEIGIESFDEGILLENLRKAPGKEQQEKIIDLCHRLGIRVIANYILGLSNDTVAGVQNTIGYAKKLNTFAIQFTVTTPYPGTLLYKSLQEHIFEEDWEKFNGWTNVYTHPTMTSEELHRLREEAYVTYHLRPRYVWRFLISTVLRGLPLPDFAR
ncbi:MAG TPA: radical SAM protein, partial [Terriglobia bacterium]|nr:radical SAM protein [Terriglobia bacterium]